MRQKLQKSLVTSLLFFVFACSKENNNKENTPAVISATEETNSFAMGQYENVELDSSDWTWYYDWNCDGSNIGATTIRFNSDHTWTNGQGDSGDWSMGVGMMIIRAKSDNCPSTTYAGNIRHQDTIQGLMVAFVPSNTGCFRMIRGVARDFKGTTTGTGVDGKTADR